MQGFNKILIILFLVIFFVSAVNAYSSYRDYTNPNFRPSGVCTDNDRSLEYCEGMWLCLLRAGSQYDECCVNGRVGACPSEDRGKIAEPECSESCGAWSNPGQSCGTRACHRCNPEGDTSEDTRCPEAQVEEINTHIISSGRYAWNYCGNTQLKGTANCEKVEWKDYSGRWVNSPSYGCGDKVYGDNYRVVCKSESAGPSSDGGPVTSKMTVSESVASCATTTGSWDRIDPVTNEGCGTKISHICPQNIDNVEAKICSIRLEAISCDSCQEKCTNDGKQNGVCYSSELPGTTLKSFFGLWDYGCGSGQKCYCYNPGDFDTNVRIFESGNCRSGDSSDASPQSSAGEINVGCSNDNQCESGFCNEAASVCIDECHTKTSSQCESDSKCQMIGTGSSSVCANKAGIAKIYSIMPRMFSENRDEEITALNDFKKILENYYIDYGEYIQAFDSKNSELEAGISSLTFRAVKLTGSAVRINTRIGGCPDFDSNSKVDFDDFLLFADNFNKLVDASTKKFDLSKDDYNIIGFGDFLRFKKDFGKDINCYYPNQEYDISKREGSCDSNNICSYNFKVKSKYPGEGDKLKVLMGENLKEISINFDKGSEEYLEQGLKANIMAIKDVTSSTVRDITGNALTVSSPVSSSTPTSVARDTVQQRSRFECGLRINPELCCPSGYISSSDNSRCVIVPVMAVSEVALEEPVAVVTSGVNADFNNDNEVNFVDFFMFKDNFGNEVAYNVLYDLDKDNDVDFDDFLLFSDNFGKKLESGGFSSVT